VQLAPEGQQLNPQTFHYQPDDIIPNVTWASEPRQGSSVQTAPQRALQSAAGDAGQHWTHAPASEQFSTVAVSGGHAIKPSTTTAGITSQSQIRHDLRSKLHAQNHRDLVHPLARKLFSFMPLSITSLPDSHEHRAPVGHLQRHLQQLLQSGSIGGAAAIGAGKQQPLQAGQRRRRRIRRRRRQHRRRAAVGRAAPAASSTAAAHPVASGAVSGGEASHSPAPAAASVLLLCWQGMQGSTVSDVCVLTCMRHSSALHEHELACSVCIACTSIMLS